MEDYKIVHFYGDKTDPGGNDHEIYASDRTIGHKVSNPLDAQAQVLALIAS